ncbi:MAG TPA: MmgE/PrpD family protein, partial [Thermohalobaculum sp.]|nr:MmgE/PrpD family protein [Thermohalobaculum sp.]
MSGITEHVLALAALPAERITPAARRMGALSLGDWITVALAGADQPLGGIIRDYVLDEGGRPVATLVGGDKAPPRAAALANGTISHALDYDDTHFGHVGHLSVGIYPAALAVGEATGASAAAVRDAFVLGAEAAIRIGTTLGRAHYDRGFHQTATAGAFGAAVAAGRLYGLDERQMRNALGLCSTRASGLKVQFGTMGKPLNAGIAAANGVEAAGLAARGFTSADDGLAGPQGFLATHSDAPEAGDWDGPPPFLFEANTYKLHACCHGLHAMIEALAALRRQDERLAETATAVEVRTHPRLLNVCDIKAPRTGLEVKFSYAWLAAMTLSGVDTAAERTYTDALARDEELTAIAGRVRVEG